MLNDLKQSVGRFVWRHPWWTGSIVVILGLLIAGAVPAVGGLLGLLVIGAGLGGEVAFRNRVRNALPEAPQPAQLMAPPPQPLMPPQVPPSSTPNTVMPSPGWRLPHRDPPRKPKTERPTLTAIASQLDLDPTARELDEQVEVVGETYYSRQFKVLFRSLGEEISSRGTTLKNLPCVLVPDPWNEYDANAVAVVIGGQHIGHLPAELAEDYTWPLRRIAENGLLVPGQARIWAKDDDGMIRARVTILIPGVEDL